jgi:hypothetical protein
LALGHNGCVVGCRELQAQEALQNGQLSSGDGLPDLQPGVLASQAMIEKILGEDPRWQGELRQLLRVQGSTWPSHGRFFISVLSFFRLMVKIIY